MATLTAKAREAIRSGSFAVPGKRKLPIEDAAHVRNAASRLGQTEGLSSGEKATAKAKIVKAAERYGIKTKLAKGKK